MSGPWEEQPAEETLSTGFGGGKTLCFGDAEQHSVRGERGTGEVREAGPPTPYGHEQEL